MKRPISVLALAVLGAATLLGCEMAGAPSQGRAGVATAKDGRPNVLLIVSDDMGYSDIAPFGGEIRTPNLRALAARGLVLSDFHTAPTCSPARSMLLSGNDNHVAGLGTMGERLDATTNLRGQPGYEGYLNFSVAPLPQLLRENGYHTYMTGKWHLGAGAGQKPSDRGFEETYVLISGGASHWSDKKPIFPGEEVKYFENGEEVNPPQDFYSTRSYTDKLIEFIDKNRGDGKPFFGYLAYTAPHDPLHVPDEWIDRYKGVYDEGYDELREARFRRLKELGFLEDRATLPDRMESIPRWETLSAEDKKIEARKMELYAAMVEFMDAQIGRVVEALEASGQLDNTLIIFVSDNGANGGFIQNYPGSSEEWVRQEFNNAYANYGRRGSGIATGPGWAQASMSPFRLYKSFTSEGGTRAPFIAAGYGVEARSESGALTHIMDIAPTVLELAGVSYPEKHDGTEMKPMLGKSMLPLLAGTQPHVRTDQEYLGWELFGNRAVRQGDWKILWIVSPNGSDRWELYNIRNDPGETVDLSDQHREKFEEMKRLWSDYQSRNGVVIPEFKAR
ncbi:MAG: arylsulfatase [bacterium]|nr:arylsulfatase [bacterium]